jgi:hypothetical protein
MHVLLWIIAASAAVPQQFAFGDSSRLGAPSVFRSGPLPFVRLPRHEPVLRLGASLPPLIQQRPKAVELSEGYYTRLKIHRYTSYAMVPLFVAQYAIGRRLYNQTGENESLRGLHGVAAGGLYGLFAVNTVTGTWNLWEGRAQREGRTRRYVHSALMLAAGAGFVATSMLAPDDDEGAANTGRRRTHRTVAIASMSTALVGNLMMLIWNK